MLIYWCSQHTFGAWSQTLSLTTLTNFGVFSWVRLAIHYAFYFIFHSTSGLNERKCLMLWCCILIVGSLTHRQNTVISVAGYKRWHGSFRKNPTGWLLLQNISQEESSLPIHEKKYGQSPLNLSWDIMWSCASTSPTVCTRTMMTTIKLHSSPLLMILYWRPHTRMHCIGLTYSVIPLVHSLVKFQNKILVFGIFP